MDETSPTTVVVMGVSGSGKTTVGQELARRAGWAFAEGDRFHPASNVAKMRDGIPLDDEDRWPWLEAIADWIGEQETAGRDAVVSCSALRRAYRDLLRSGHPSVWFAHVSAPRAVLEQRLASRTGHYMAPSLLDSQLTHLEPLAAEEPGSVIDDRGDLDAVISTIVDRLGRGRRPAAGSR